ncbi:MAG: hypothetical protein N3H31_04635 [Candidatus Nezhaarchaeota archaeon]|nr:hypothetical protein [Candidatus Nezhaarchaeota archaeon]
MAKTVHDYVKREGATAVVVSHDTLPVSDLADVVIRMERGKLVSIEEA